MIPPSYLYPWLDREPVDATPSRCRPVAGLVASIVAGGVSGAVAAVTVLMAGLA
jgi:hypothetical protein